MQADRCLEAGNLDGKAVWMRGIARSVDLDDHLNLHRDLKW